MGMADDVRRYVTMQDAARHYGFELNRSGFMKCPFHSGDRTASLKVYDGAGGFHCFGCGAHGSVIDFVMQLFNLNFKQAILRINADFRLGLSNQRASRSDYSRVLEERKKEAERLEREYQEYRQNIRDLWYYREVLGVFPPIRTGDDVYFHPLYVEAIQRLPYIEYQLEDYLEKGGGSHWKTSLSLQEKTT